MPSCAIIICKARSQESKGKITFHRFPKEPDVCKQWMEVTGRRNWNPTKLSTVCSQHFDDKDFEEKKSGNKYLKHGVVPHKNVVRLANKTISSTLPPRIPHNQIHLLAVDLPKSKPELPASDIEVLMSDAKDVMPPADYSRSVTPITDLEDGELQAKGILYTFKEEDVNEQLTVIQDPLSESSARGSFKQLPEAGQELYILPSTSNVELIAKEEVNQEELLDYKALYFKLLDEVTLLKSQQLYKENQNLIEINKRISQELENLIAKNQKYVSDIQNLISENQNLTENNRNLAANIQHLSEKIKNEVSEESRAKDRDNIFTDYIEKIESLNITIRCLTEENKCLTEKNRTLEETVQKYSKETQKFKMKDKLQRDFIQRLKSNCCKNKLDKKSRIIKALRLNLVKLKARLQRPSGAD